jgi:hypothetical protein
MSVPIQIWKRQSCTQRSTEESVHSHNSPDVLSEMSAVVIMFTPQSTMAGIVEASNSFAIVVDSLGLLTGSNGRQHQHEPSQGSELFPGSVDLTANGAGH